MPSLTFILSLALLSTISSAGRDGINQKATRTFTVPQHARYAPHPNGPAALRYTYLKYNMTLPSKNGSALGVDGLWSDSVINNPVSNDTRYLIPVQFGAAEDTLYLDLDTGSANLWVFSTLQPESQREGHNLYNVTETGTNDNGTTFLIQYGGGDFAQGRVYNDTVGVGDIVADALPVGAAYSVAQSLTPKIMDGILGLGLGQSNCYPHSCLKFMDAVQDQLDDFVVTATLKHEQPGQYDFGFVNESLYIGDLTTVPVVDNSGFWSFRIDGYCVESAVPSFQGNNSDSSISTITNAYTEFNFTAFADTGTSLLLLPQALVSDYYSAVPNSFYDNSSSESSYLYMIPCAAPLPDLTLYFGLDPAGHTMPGSYANYSVAGLFSTPDGTDKQMYCYGGIQSIGNSGRYAVIGAVFLKSQFVVFNYTEPASMGWAQQA